MRVLVLYAHPVEASFCAALRTRAVEALERAGHEVDLCDLYAEGFEAAMSREERIVYEDEAENRKSVNQHVDRLTAAEALVLVFPVWNFGFPAILKGYLDRVFLPGVSFSLRQGGTRPHLTGLRRIVGIATYGAPWWVAFFLRDPPRRMVRRVLRAIAAPRAATEYYALYGMDEADDAKRQAFLDDVDAAMARLR